MSVLGRKQTLASKKACSKKLLSYTLVICSNMVHERRSNEPEINLGQSTTLVEMEFPALATCLEDSFFETRRLRKDGWDGASMATFIGTLAETGVVTFACRACGMSAQSAYALRHRDPLFAKAVGSGLVDGPRPPRRRIARSFPEGQRRAAPARRGDRRRAPPFRQQTGLRHPPPARPPRRARRHLPHPASMRKCPRPLRPSAASGRLCSTP